MELAVRLPHILRPSLDLSMMRRRIGRPGDIGNGDSSTSSWQCRPLQVRVTFDPSPDRLAWERAAPAALFPRVNHERACTRAVRVELMRVRFTAGFPI